MVLIEDDTILHPDIDQDILFYITNLNEGIQAYTRFFDALLIKRSLHRSFFHDLKTFREQPQVISLLDSAGNSKEIYREVTIVYLSSRFAHPWCRKTPLKKGFWRAEWGTINGRQRDAEMVKEEQRLHKLLVPLWIIMRARMFPGEEIVREWCLQERGLRENKEKHKLTVSALQLHDAEVEQDRLQIDGVEAEAVSDSGLDEQERRAAAHAATSVFRLAAAGMILSQTPKRKLRWLTKKPT